jgi:polysaccharide pyruvyl transferase WcaK-like protein
LAHILNKPVLAIAHHPKVTDLMQSLGLSEYCVDMLSFDPIRLMDTFRSLVANAAAIKAGMAERLVETREQSKAQFDELFGPPRLSATLVRDLERAVAYKSRA